MFIPSVTQVVQNQLQERNPADCVQFSGQWWLCSEVIMQLLCYTNVKMGEANLFGGSSVTPPTQEAEARGSQIPGPTEGVQRQTTVSK